MYGWNSSPKRRPPGTADADNPAHAVTERRRQEDLVFMSLVKTASVRELRAMEKALVEHAEKMKKPRGWRIVAVQRRLRALGETTT